MTYFLAEKALNTALVPGYHGFQSFDVGVATILNIECAVLLHEIRKKNYQMNYDKKTNIIEENDIEDIKTQLEPIFSKKTLEKCLRVLLKKSYIKKIS